jgi:hypothetical protein
MVRVSLLSCLVLAACGSNAGRGDSVCDQMPPPPECEQTCDPSPGAPNDCPAGFHCSPDGVCDALCTPTGGECGDGWHCTSDGRCEEDGACVGLECDVVDCQGMGMPSTTLSGTVFAPNGTLPLYGVSVYVPNSDPGPLTDGAVCDQCGDPPGSPIGLSTTDETGRFVLTDVPAGDDVPLVIVTGKWRRQITIPTVAACADTPLAATDTRLPRNGSEGDMPRIAISTGNADALDCLVRKLGIDDAEISTAGQAGHVHLYANNDSPGRGARTFESGFPGGNGDFADSAAALWDNVDQLMPYDLVFLSCEGRQDPDTKPQAALDAMQQYADRGGRVFASHWHNIWIGGNRDDQSHGIADWQAVADFRFGGNPNPDTLTATIDEVSNPKGASFATWMVNVMGSMTRGLIVVNESRTTCSTVDTDLGERWVYLDPATSPDESSVMNFQFTTPQNVPIEQRCGKVVFSDMHVSADSSSDDGTPYPRDCSTSPLTAQEKALAFMFFDLASCVDIIVD